MRCHIAAWQKPNTHGASRHQEFWFGMPRTEAQLNNLLRATTPALNQAPTIKDLRDQWISRPRQMLPFEVLHLDTRRKPTRTPDFQAVIVDCHADRSAGLGIIPMTERVDQGLAQRDRWE